jgi:hypothetical protein
MLLIVGKIELQARPLILQEHQKRDVSYNHNSNENFIRINPSGIIMRRLRLSRLAADRV